MDSIDRSKLTPDQVAQLDQYNSSQKQLNALEDVSATVEQLVITLEQGQTKDENSTEKLGALLTDMRTQLANMASKEVPRTPDYAKPVVDALSKLEEALTHSLKGIDVKPEVNLPETQVNIAPPDLSGVEKLLKNEVPRAFQAAIKAIPKTEIPEADYTPLVDKLSEMSDKLSDIDRASRMKPLPGSMSILANGSAVSTANPLPTNATFSGTVTSSPTFKDDPTNSGETPKYGKTNPSTHKQQVEADTGLTQPTTPADTQPVSAVTLPLPTGASTSALQSTGNTSLGSIKTNTDNLDVALSTRLKAADTLTKVATVDTITNVVHIDDNGGSVTVDGPLTDTQLRATPVPVSGTVSTGGLTDTQLRATPVPISGNLTNISGTVSLPTGASTAGNQITGNASLSSIDTKLSGTLAVSATTLPQATLPASPKNNQVTVSTAGTRVQLGSNTLTVGVIVQALSTNTGLIYLGDSAVSSGNGFELQAGQATSAGVSNTNALWVDASVNGDKICFIGS